MRKQGTGKAAREKGHNAERLIAQMFRDIGFEHACTTRASSNLLDSCGIDINYVPIIVQIKAGIQRGLSIPSELEYIQTQMILNLPPEESWHSKLRAVIQIKPPAKNRRSDYDSIVSMTLTDWMRLVQLAYPPPKTYRNNESDADAATRKSGGDEGLPQYSRH
jgi:hypothetical protein